MKYRNFIKKSPTLLNQFFCSLIPIATMQSKKLFAIATVFALAFSCQKPAPEPDNIFKFRDYISYTTNGLVSVKDPIRINLAKEVEGWDLGQEISDKIFDIKPHVEGTLKAENKHTLLFTPDEPLDPGTEYAVTIKLNKLFPNIKSEFKDYTFQFKTIAPNFNIKTGNLQSYSKDWQYLEGALESADIISLQNAKQLVEVSQNNKKLSLQWDEFNTEAKVFEFRIDSINRIVEDGEILIKWNGKAIGSDNVGENTIAIPGKNNFKIVDVSVIQSPEQYLSINFSDPLKKQQNFDGLVSIQNTKNPKYIVNGNVLNVYPDNKLVGNILVEVFQGIKNTDDYKLKQPFSETISFEELKPKVRLLTNGVILPNSEDLKFNFEAVNLKAVDVRIIKIFEDNILQFLQDNELGSNNEYEIKRVGRRIAKQTITLINNPSENTGKWKAYSIDLSKFFKADPGALYRVELSFNKDYSLYDCEANITTSTDDDEDEYYYDDYYYEEDYYENSDAVSSEDDEIREEAYWDNQLYSYKNYHYNWRERDNPCHEAYYNNEKTVAQNLLASNLGVIAKRGSNNSYHFAVTNILTTQPESNAKVTLYNFQQQPIADRTTDNEGLTIIDTDKVASFAIVSKGNNTTYVKLADGNSLSLSKFDVSGNQLQRGLKGYIYGERGVWRPGDTLFLTFVLNDKANKLPNGHPIKLEITDPMGKLVYKSLASVTGSNFYDFPVPTSTEDKTGNYNAKVSVGGATFYKQLKVETVKPNRLKLKIDFDKEVLSSNKPLQGSLDVKWLHGAPAKNLKADIQVKFRPNNSGFKNYKNYVFSDPTKEFTSEETTVFEGKTNDEGLATINTNLKVEKNAPGMLTASFLVRAFENGGDFSIDAFSKPYAPYESFVGLKSPNPQAYGSFFTDETQTFDVATVDKDGNPVKRDSLEVKLYKIEWRWWWSSSYDNLSSYISSKYHLPYKSFTIKTDVNGKASFKVNIPDDDRGRYLIRIFDPKSGHATGRTAYFYKNWWHIPTGDKDAAKMLVFSADKEQYNVGETAKITFPSGNEGRALISIENGTEVLQQQWVATKKGETQVDIPISKEMAPNVFVNISLLQPHAITAKDNTLPIRLYGVIPLNVENPNTRLNPQLKMPDVLRPEQEFEVSISEKNNKAMTYTIAIVDEGLLDLTRFQTPNVWDEFYKRQALGVKTWDIYDDVIGAYSGSIDQVFAIGGDGSAAAGKNKKANRFKPVVKYLGPFHLNAGDTQVHKVKLPNYIGAVRTMVVAGNNTTEAYGSTDKSVQVKKPLMVVASLPRKLSPGEKVTLPVTVFAMESKVKNVSVSLKLSDGIKVLGEQTQSLTFAKPDEQMLFFDLDVTKDNSIQTVEVIAKGNGENASYKVEMDVFNPNPYTSKYHTITLEPKATQTISFETFGVPGTNKAQIEFSTLPPMNFTGRLNYLIRYPHGCVEQTTSSVFPQLFLMEIFDLPYDKKQEVQKNIEKGIQRLAQFQNPSGGLGYWMGETSVSDWGTSYAGHFMLEAEKQGYVLPVMFKTNWLRYQQKAAREWRPTYRVYHSDLAQAYRLYTLALAGQPDLASMNRLREFSEISNEAKWRLAAAYALAGQKEASDKISATANIDFKSSGDYYTYGSVDRNRAMALETMVLTKNPKMRELAEVIAKDLSRDYWMSTQTTAYSLLAMGKMVKANGGKSMNVSFTDSKEKTTVNSQNAIAQRALHSVDGSNTITVSNAETNVVYVRILNSGKLPLGQELAEQRGLSVSLSYTDLNGNKLDVRKLQQGQDFVATIKVSNLSKNSINDVALTQIFPSGWEIVNTRFTDFNGGTTSTARYTDIRDDRVNFYFDLGTDNNNMSKTFTVLLNASYLGTYYLPGTQAEAMYDNDYLVRNKGQWVEVTKQ